MPRYSIVPLCDILIFSEKARGTHSPAPTGSPTIEENKLRPHKSLVSASSFSRENCLWSTSSSLKQLQCFLDFANVLQDDSKVVSPPTSLTSTLKPGGADIQMSEVPVPPAPILFHPDPSHQLIMELDDSIIRVSAFLSP